MHLLRRGVPFSPPGGLCSVGRCSEGPSQKVEWREEDWGKRRDSASFFLPDGRFPVSESAFLARTRDGALCLERRDILCCKTAIAASAAAASSAVASSPWDFPHLKKGFRW